MKFPFQDWAHYSQLLGTEHSDEPHDSNLPVESDFIEEAGSKLKARKLYVWQSWRIAVEIAILACSIIVLFASARRSSYFHYQECQCGSSWNQLESRKSEGSQGLSFSNPLYSTGRRKSHRIRNPALQRQLWTEVRFHWHGSSCRCGLG